jgi:hypothetical protein
MRYDDNDYDHYHQKQEQGFAFAGRMIGRVISLVIRGIVNIFRKIF